MMIRFISIFAAFSLAITSVSAGQIRPGTDGYMFENKTFTKKNVEIEFVTFKSRRDLNIFARENKWYLPNDTQSFSVWTMNGTKCTIYTIDPSVSYIPEQYGHELTHCVYGNWHPYKE